MPSIYSTASDSSVFGQISTRSLVRELGLRRGGVNPVLIGY